MATRANQTSAAPKPADPPSSSIPPAPFLGQRASGPSLGSVPMLLTPGRGPWTWCVSPARLGCRNGRIVPLVVAAYHSPGLSANVQGDGGSGWVQQLTREGYIPVGHQYGPVVAFGQQRAVLPPSTYLSVWDGVDMEGRAVQRWTDAWRRPMQLGSTVVWEDDPDGRDAFLVQVLIELANNGQPLNKAQIAIATQPTIERIKAEAGRDTPTARALIRSLALHLPPEYRTAEVRDILARLEISLPDVTQ